MWEAIGRGIRRKYEPRAGKAQKAAAKKVSGCSQDKNSSVWNWE